MRTEKFSFGSHNKVNTIACIIWLPEGQAKGIIQILHGMADRIGRYDETASFFTSKGYIVCGHDQIGHGDSIIDELGYIPNHDGFLDLVEDVELMRKEITKKYPNLNYFLLGHSMGSAVAKIYSSKYGHLIDGLLLSGTNYKSRGIDFAISLTKYYMNKKGIKAKATEVDKMVFSNINKRFAPIRTVSDWLSRDPEQVDKFVQDPKCCYLFTNIAYLNMLYLIKMAGQKKILSSIPLNLPIYIFSGSEDVSNNLSRGSTKLYHALKRMNYKNVKSIVYQGGRHEMLNEINKEEVCNDILAWIENLK